MSMARRCYVSLFCDAGCSTRLDTECASHVGARVEAGQRGWRYAEGIWLCDPEQRKDYNKRTGKEQTLRAIDVCPSCEVPPQGTRITRATAVLVSSERRSAS